MIATVEWPSISLTIFGWTPRPSSKVAAEWRALWNGIGGTCEAARRRRHRFHVVVTDSGRSPEENRTTLEEMSAAAIALRPKLLLRARELCGRRDDVDAEDLVGVALLALVAKPPNPKTPAQLHRWLRTVLRN